ncbi:hypothetical protein FKW77_006272 [Venturia effusa]|uniref:CBM1 domain-containing protein n=1 Tax=Venturia effusa TaxID=50376 RepID=A0A517LLU7_9PEZI|nr:hypothetical protein FKW77_006272 [Venturia effusa]
MQFIHLILIGLLNFATLGSAYAYSCEKPPANCKYGLKGGSWAPCTQNGCYWSKGCDPKDPKDPKKPGVGPKKHKHICCWDAGLKGEQYTDS